MSTACCSQRNWAYLTTSTVLSTVFAVLAYHCVVLFVRGTVTVTCRHSWVTWRSVRVVIGIRGRREYVLASQLGIVRVAQGLVRGMKWRLLPPILIALAASWWFGTSLKCCMCSTADLVATALVMHPPCTALLGLLDPFCLMFWSLKGWKDWCQMHRIQTWTLLFQHNNGVEILLHYLLQMTCTATPFSMPTVWDHLEGSPGSQKQNVSMDLGNPSLTLSPCYAGILKKVLHIPKPKLPEISQCGESWAQGMLWAISLDAFSCLCQLFRIGSKNCMEWWSGFFPVLGVKNTCSLFLAELCYVEIVTSRLLLPHSEPTQLGNFQVAEFNIHLILASALDNCSLLVLLPFWEHGRS